MRSSDEINKTKEIYFLSEYNWERGTLIRSATKTNLIEYIPDGSGGRLWQQRVKVEKCATPDELVCVVFEEWKGTNGRGGHRVERNLYPSLRVRACNIGRQDGLGRVWESSYGVIRP